jgi:hypothetical protein
MIHNVDATINYLRRQGPYSLGFKFPDSSVALRSSCRNQKLYMNRDTHAIIGAETEV